MITQDLIDNIKTNLAAGQDDEAIKQELRTKGFPNDDIDQAFLNAKSGAPGEKIDENANGWHLTKKEVFIGLATLLILASLAFMVFSPNGNIGRVLGAFTK